MFEKVLRNPELRAVAQEAAPGRVVTLARAWGSSVALVAAGIERLTGRCVLLVTTHLDQADELADDLQVFSGRPARILPAWETDLAAEHLSSEVAAERLQLCMALASPARDARCASGVIVAPIMALLQPVPTLDALRAAKIALRTEQQLDPAQLAAWLLDAGYERLDQVDQQGQFARRGGIVDIFPQAVEEAVRIEFFDDEITSIRKFDLDTQRSTAKLDAYELTSTTIGLETDPERTTSFLHYLPDEAIVCTVEPGEARQLAEDVVRRLEEDRREERPDGRARAPSIRPEELFDEMERFARVQMHAFSPRPAGQMVDLGIRSLQRLETNTHEALRELADLSQTAAVWVYCENAAERERFAEVLAAQHPDLAAVVHLAIGHVGSGFHWPQERLLVVGHHQIYHRYAKVRRIRRVRAGRPIDSMLDLQVGDHVVHVAHGIAVFEGLRMLDRDGVSEEFLTLRFAGNAVLHVPAGRIDLVQKYIGARGARPSLSKLGGGMWAKQKQRAAEAINDMAAEMIRMQAVRRAMPGIAYPVKTDWQRKFADEFIYTETEDQLLVADRIGEDMSMARPMDHLVCGDVGYGKTELAMRAAFRAAEAGKQVAILVPTTVLATQHYRTFTERFADYPFEIDVLSRFRTGREQTDVLKRLAAGRIDILIGTHRILSKDVLFGDLGLVVIDEEQRFGVEHKERLKRLRSMVDVLTMTATPIPRTLHMALLGLRDISSLTSPPLDRRAIYTEVCQYDDGLIGRAVRRELNRDGQVFFVHNRVMDIEPLADHVRGLVPDATVEVAHGQMPEGRLEDTMCRFVRREIDVLVCTTIIESGLDIPTVNTMIIHESDRFGLAELHQLRGRIGRYKHRAYCYLLLPEGRPVSAAAAKRLKAIEEFSDLGAGFQIAMRDLELRGAGNVLGREQSGHIAAVGYELYCQLLEKAVRELTGEQATVRRHVHLELGIEAHLPRTYVPSQRQRMEAYRRLAQCTGPDELEQLAADLADAYGPVPEEVSILLDLAEIRVLAAPLGIESILREEPDLIFSIADVSAVGNLFDGAAGTVRVPDGRTVHWRVPRTYFESPTLLRVLTKRLREASLSV